MAYLREAVQKQKEFLINQLINEGKINADKDELHTKTIQELINEYDEFLITTQKSKNNSLKFTRSVSIRNERKPN